MKKYFLLIVFFFLVIIGWVYKRDIALTLLPIALNISIPIADNQDIEWQKSESKENIDKQIEDILNPSSLIGNNNDLLQKSFTSPLKEAREHFEKEYLITQLKKNHGNISKTADFIGMERSALHRKLKELGIKGIN